MAPTCSTPPAGAREWILFTDEQPVVTVHPVRDADRIQRPYQGTYMSAHRYVMKTFSDTKSATLRTKAERFLTGAPCPVCGGSRLRPEALAVTFGGRTIAESAQTAIIFGMPNEAIKTGCIDQVLPLSEIPKAIHRMCTGPG